MNPPIARLIKTLADDISLRRVTFYGDPKNTIKVTRQRKVDRRCRQETFLFTFGRANYAERHFIKLCQKAGVKFPLRKLQLKRWPEKR